MKRIAFFILFEQLSHLAATIAKDIRSASLKRNAELSSAFEQIDKASQTAIEAIESGISAPKKGAISQKLKSAQNAISNSSTDTDDAIGQYYQRIAFEELDMIIGKLKGATSYKALNAINSLTNTEKKILERVLNVISGLAVNNSSQIIDTILTVCPGKSTSDQW